MNYYNPYFYTMPNSVSSPKVGLFSRLFGGKVTFSSILNGTQRALNFANQTIPLVKQVRPMISNAKTMFKVMNEFKKSDLKNSVNKTKQNDFDISNDEVLVPSKKDDINSYGPTFFI